MNESHNVVNLEVHASATTAPLKNVALCTRLLEQAINRPAHLPGLVCFYGPSGWGKSFAAAYAAIISLVVYREISLRDLWRALVEASADSAKILLVVAMSGAFVWIAARVGIALELAQLLGSKPGADKHNKAAKRQCKQCCIRLLFSDT